MTNSNFMNVGAHFGSKKTEILISCALYHVNPPLRLIRCVNINSTLPGVVTEALGFPKEILAKHHPPHENGAASSLRPKVSLDPREK